MQSYDPDNAPDPREWLGLNEEDRLRKVERYYADKGGYGGRRNCPRVAGCRSGRIPFDYYAV